MKLMKLRSLTLVIMLAGSAAAGLGSPAKEFLTEKEIAQIQDAQEVDRRVKIYLDAADLRLKEAERRLSGEESQAGDPLEFFTVEDMLDSYYRIVRSVMSNLDDAFEKPKAGVDKGNLGKALKNLKESTEKAIRDLEFLKKAAEDKKNEGLWNLVNNAIDITNGAHEGAELGLSKQPQTPPEKRKKNQP